MSRKGAIEPGDDEPLKPYSRLQVVNRSLLGVTHAGHAWAVDYDFFDWDDRVSLYRDGRRAASAKAPVSFEVPDGRIEFATTFYGVKRAHLVLGTGAELPLGPHPKTLEAWRQRLADRHPMLSALMAGAAVVVLVVGLVVAGMSLLDTVTHVPQVADALGWTFTSPLALSGAAATALTVAGVLAIIERALSMRHHWLLDADTWWTG